jgi:hypothetical protein
MEQKIKSITRQLAIAAFILISVTVLSFGIRWIRFNAQQVKTIEKFLVADDIDSGATPSTPVKNQSLSRQPSNTNFEPDFLPEELHTSEAEFESAHADELDSDKDAPLDDYSEVEPFKDDNTRAEGSKSLQKLSVGEYENLYLTEKGEYWYVSKDFKMQVQLDEDTGELNAVGGGYHPKSEGSQEYHRIPIAENEDIYLTREGQAWYVNEQPDGSTAKMQLQTKNIDGEVAIIGGDKMNVYPANDDKPDED